MLSGRTGTSPLLGAWPWPPWGLALPCTGGAQGMETPVPDAGKGAGSNGGARALTTLPGGMTPNSWGLQWARGGWKHWKHWGFSAWRRGSGHLPAHSYCLTGWLYRREEEPLGGAQGWDRRPQTAEAQERVTIHRKLFHPGNRLGCGTKRAARPPASSGWLCSEQPAALESSRLPSEPELFCNSLY